MIKDAINKVLIRIFPCFPGSIGMGDEYLRIDEIGPDQEFFISGKEALVLGKFLLIENGKVRLPFDYSTMDANGNTHQYIELFHLELRKRKPLELGRDGSFYWIMPRGSYTVRFIRYDTCDIKPQVAFEVSEEGNAFYIGTLKVDVRLPHNLFRRNTVQLEIIDESGKANKTMRGFNPLFASYKPRTRLMNVIPNSHPRIQRSAACIASGG